MLTNETIREEYLNHINEKNKDKEIDRSVFSVLGRLGEKDIAQWEDEDLDKFLTNAHSISIMSLQKHIQIAREIHEFACNKQGVPYRRLEPTKDLLDYLDLDKLLSVTLTLSHYQNIKNQLLAPGKDGEDHNYRDKVLFMLAWEGLKNSEIKNLKINDIEFVSEDEVKIHLNNRTVTITNTIIDGIRDDVVQDIKRAINERFYLRQEANGREMLIPYKDTEYLIRPVDMHTSSKDDRVQHPVAVLKSALKNVVCPGIDVDGLSIREIRRSKMIYLLALDMEVRPSDIQELWSKKSVNDLYWLKKVAKIIYNK